MIKVFAITFFNDSLHRLRPCLRQKLKNNPDDKGTKFEIMQILAFSILSASHKTGHCNWLERATFSKLLIACG